MSTQEALALSARVRHVVVRTLDLGIVPDQLDDSTSLYSSVIRMDSLALLQLLVALEEELHIKIDDEDVMNANLSTIGSLVEMVRQAMAESADGAR